MDPTQAMDPLTAVLTYVFPGVPLGVWIGITWLVTWLYSSFTQSLLSPVEGGSRTYLFFFRFFHRLAGNTGLARKEPKPAAIVNRLAMESTLTRVVGENEELRLRLAAMEERVAALKEDKPDATSA
jgi:hypothetical protein